MPPTPRRSAPVPGTSWRSGHRVPYSHPRLPPEASLATALISPASHAATVTSTRRDPVGECSGPVSGDARCQSFVCRLLGHSSISTGNVTGLYEADEATGQRSPASRFVRIRPVCRRAATPSIEKALASQRPANQESAYQAPRPAPVTVVCLALVSRPSRRPEDAAQVFLSLSDIDNFRK